MNESCMKERNTGLLIKTPTIQQTNAIKIEPLGRL